MLSARISPNKSIKFPLFKNILVWIEKEKDYAEWILRVWPNFHK